MPEAVMDVWTEVRDKLDARYGAGNWHCDDLWAANGLPPCAQAYLDIARAPAHGGARKPPPLFGTFEGQRVRVVMASRFGDVGITTHLGKEYGYDRRVFLPDLSDLSDRP